MNSNNNDFHYVARELGFEVRTGAPRTEHSIERVKEFIGHKIRQDAEAIKPALKNVVEKYAITADELLAVRTTLEVVPIAKAGQLAQKGAGNLVRKGLTKLDQRLVQTTAQPMLFSADGVAVRNLEAGLGTVSREGKSFSPTKTYTSKQRTLTHKGVFFQKELSSKSLSELAKPIDPALVKKLEKKGWTVVVAKKGMDEFRYLTSQGAEASIADGFPKHILIKETASKSALLEEFLHGAQLKLGLIRKYGSHQALEIHVKDFMLRHSKMLGLDNPRDIKFLQRLKVEEIERLNRMGK